MKTSRSLLFAAALLAGAAAVGLAPGLALAQAAPAPATGSPSVHHARPFLLPGQLVDGHIAFLKAELKITPAQEAQWQKVAAAMEENAAALDKAIGARAHKGAVNAVERMETRAEFAKLRADNAERLLAAFKPLYASLSPEQQQRADNLMLMRAGWHHGWHRA
jgi:periplasmic protein CpxP/Spy